MSERVLRESVHSTAERLIFLHHLSGELSSEAGPGTDLKISIAPKRYFTVLLITEPARSPARRAGYLVHHWTCGTADNAVCPGLWTTLILQILKIEQLIKSE